MLRHDFLFLRRPLGGKSRAEAAPTREKKFHLGKIAVTKNGRPFPIPACAERRERGRGLRSIVGRVDQGEWRPAENRPDPLLMLERINKQRLRELVPIKMGRMAASPFGFLRGAAPLMAQDLAEWPTTGLTVQMCGDAHVGNLGAFAAPDGHLLFDLNDFDESMPGPWEWDVKRLATSLVLAGRSAGESEAGCRDAVQGFVAQYRTAMALFAELSVFELAKFEIRRRSQIPLVRAVLSKAERATREHLLEKLTEKKQGHRHFRFDPPLLRHVCRPVARSVIASLREYRETLGPDRQLVFDAYRPVAVAFKVAGTGSVALRNYVILCLGRTINDAIFLQIKEAQEACAAPYLANVTVPANNGRRIAEGQHRMQTVSDPLLGWTVVGARHFLVRQLADHKARIDTTELHGDTLSEYASVCGRVLAKGHARTGDPLALAAYCGRSDKLDRAMAKFAFAYADQTTHDYELLLRAIRRRRVKALLQV
jgi:uncharacterized protein (DUF2252 family)